MKNGAANDRPGNVACTRPSDASHCGAVPAGLSVVPNPFDLAGPLLRIGNTTSRVDFGCHPGEWADAWSATGISHHWALGTGNLVPELRAVAGLLGTGLTEVAPH